MIGNYKWTDFLSELRLNFRSICYSGNATYRGRRTIGDDVTYDVDTWFIADTPWGNITVSVMAHDCTPVMQGTSTNENNG